METEVVRPKYEDHDLPGIGEIRTHSGTALSTIAGGMKYWHEEALKAQSALAKVQTRARLDGATAGAGAILIFQALILTVYHYLRK